MSPFNSSPISACGLAGAPSQCQPRQTESSPKSLFHAEGFFMSQSKGYCISASASYNDYVSFHNFRNREGCMRLLKRKIIALFTVFVLLLIGASPRRQAINSDPPNEIVKLVFIHHSTGENWLTDDYGDLGRTLDENNYFVSDTNYGWGPKAIGDRTDIPNWTEWFASNSTPTYLEALFSENEQHASYTRTLSDPGGENEIIMFKSCFPNSALEGSPNDPPDSEGEL